MRFEMGSNESCACGARPLQVAGRKAGIDEPYEWKSSRTGLWGASGASPAPTRQYMRRQPAEILFLDLKLPGMNGSDLCREVHRQ
jgi:CheY-like chemotaxis protein